MKIYHFAIIFVIFAIGLFIELDLHTKNLTAILTEKDWLNQCFDKAIDDAANQLVEINGIHYLQVNKEEAVNTFFESLYASLTIIDNPIKQMELKKYIPIIAITVEDGFYINFWDEYISEDSYKTIVRTWSEKIPYHYEDEDFIYRFTLSNELTVLDKNGILNSSLDERVHILDLYSINRKEEFEEFRNKRPNSLLLSEEKLNAIKRESIIKSIEQSLMKYCKEYNEIGTHFGINYSFFIPSMDNSEWIRTIDNPSIIVLFQGYPYGVGTRYIFNRMSIAGARVKKSHVFYIEQKEWYLLYHKENCPQLMGNGIIHLTQPYYRLIDCVKEGAYACSTCNETGAFPPSYVP